MFDIVGRPKSNSYLHINFQLKNFNFNLLTIIIRIMISKTGFGNITKLIVNFKR